jgi:hypothetical protein
LALILKWILGKFGWEGVDWTQERDQWWELVNMITNIQAS